MSNTINNVISTAGDAANAANAAANTNTSGTSGSGSLADKNAAASEALNTNFSDFLKLLTTQLQNQDPTAPADVNQMTQEIATLSQVEQQINTNNALQQLVGLFGAQQLNNSVSYIGKQVDAAGSQGVLNNGQAVFVYNLPPGVSSAEVDITSSTGQTVFTGSGTTLAGRNQVIWDGTNNINGQTMPPGSYSITVKAKDGSGKDVTATTLTSGIVTSVDSENGTTNLMIGDIPVSLKDVQSVRNPGA